MTDDQLWNDEREINEIEDLDPPWWIETTACQGCTWPFKWD